MSKAKSLKGSAAAVSSTPCLRLLLAVCWNGRYSSESGLYASASPSKTAVLATTCRPPQLRDDRLRVRQPLSERGTHGVADPDAEGVYSLYTSLPKRPSHQPEVGSLVVGALKPLPEALVADPGEGERVEHGRVAHPQAHPAQGYAAQIVARLRVEFFEQRGE